MHSVMRPNAVDAVAWSVCLLVMTVNPAKTDEPIEMPFTPPPPRNHVLRYYLFALFRTGEQSTLQYTRQAGGVHIGTASL